MLLEAFRPDSAQDIIQELYIPTTIQMLAKVERVSGLALGALGERGIATATKLPLVIKIAPEAETHEREDKKA